MGAEKVVCTGLIEFLALFEADDETETVVIVGEVGGTQEEVAADFIRQNMSKLVVAYVAGKSVPEGKRMGHAGAIVQEGMGSADSNIDVFKDTGVAVAEIPMDIPRLVEALLKCA